MDSAMMRVVRVVLGLLVWLGGSGVVRAQPSNALEAPSLSVGVAAVIQPQEPGFGGGTFCCDAGAVKLGWWGETGWFVSPRVSVRGELAAGRAFTNHLRAPRFVQENRHRDLTVSALFAFHPHTGGTIRPAVLAGFGMAVGRTTRTSQLLDFGPDRVSSVQGVASVEQSTDMVPAMTWGADVQIVLGTRIRLVPQMRARFLWRSDVARFEDGLARWLIEPRMGLQILF
jgi:hypothetical protein